MGGVYSNDGYCVIENKLTLSAFAPKYILGDVSGDGNVNLIDAIRTLDTVINKGSYSPAADMNKDNVINLLDVVILLKILVN